MPNVSPHVRNIIIKLLRDKLSAGDLRDIIDDFGYRVDLGGNPLFVIGGPDERERVANLVGEAVRRDKMTELYAVIEVWRADIHLELPPLIPSPPPEKPPSAGTNQSQADAYVQRGLDRAQAGDHDMAIALYTLALRAMPDLADAFTHRGAAYTAKKQYDSAIADFSMAMALDQKLADAYIKRGHCYRALGQPDKALADLTTAITLDPDDALAYYMRGSTWADTGDRLAAQADFHRAADLGSTEARQQLIRPEKETDPDEST